MLKNPVATAPGSDLANSDLIVRRQLFDDNMNENCGVMSIFLKLRGFLESTWFSRNDSFFSILRGFPAGSAPIGGFAGTFHI
jgi:hypothetical protein